MDRQLAALLVLAVVLCHTVLATNIAIFDQEQGDDAEIFRHVKASRTRRDAAAPPAGSGDNGDHHVGSGSGKAPTGSGDASDDCLEEGSGSDSSGCIPGPRPTPSPTATPSPPPSCVKPPLAQNHFNLVEEDKAVQRARCHSACLSHVSTVAAARGRWLMSCLLFFVFVFCKLNQLTTV